MTIFISICYIIALIVFTQRLYYKGEITVRDFIMLLLAPLCILPVVIVPLIGAVVDLDYPIFKQ
jgi:hypothetical protein